MIINPNSTTLARPDLAFVVTEFTSENTVYIADKILPFQPMKFRSDTFNKLKAESLAGMPNAERETGGGFNRISRKVTTDTYACLEYGLEEAIDVQDPSIYGNIVAGEQQSVLTVAEYMKRIFEKAVSDAVINETNFPASGTTGKTLTVGWDDPASTPAADVAVCAENIRAATGISKQFLTLEISPYTYAKLFSVLDVRDALKITTQQFGATITLEALAVYFGVKEVIVGTMTYNTANDGLTPSYSDMWNADYAFLFFKMEPGMVPDTKKAGLGLTFVWDYASDNSTYLVETYNQDQIASQVARVRQWRHSKIVNSLFGNLIKNTRTYA